MDSTNYCAECEQHAREVARLERELAEAKKDTERLDWLESKASLHVTPQVLYVVDGYELILDHDDGGVIELSNAPTLRAAIDKAGGE